MDWDDIRIFNAVLINRSIRRAAIVLRTSHSTVSRRIARLEKKLASRLFEKLPEGHFPTATGEALFRLSKTLNEQFFQLERLAQGRDNNLPGDIRITMPDSFAKLLMPEFSRFNLDYPDINLEIVPSYELFNMNRREADIALRVVMSSPPEHLVGRKLVTYASAIYASHEFINKHSPLEQSSNVSWIGWSDAPTRPAWIKQNPLADKPVRTRIDNILVQVEGLKAGMGVSLLPCFLGDIEPSLTRIPGAIPQPSHDVWLLTHPDLRFNARIKLLMLFITTTFDKYRPLITGMCPAIALDTH